MPWAVASAWARNTGAATGVAWDQSPSGMIHVWPRAVGAINTRATQATPAVVAKVAAHFGQGTIFRATWYISIRSVPKEGNGRFSAALSRGSLAGRIAVTIGATYHILPLDDGFADDDTSVIGTVSNGQSGISLTACKSLAIERKTKDGELDTSRYAPGCR